MPQLSKDQTYKVSFRAALKGLAKPVDVQLTFKSGDAKAMRSWLAKGSGKSDLQPVIEAAFKGLEIALNSNKLKNALTK